MYGARGDACGRKWFRAFQRARTSPQETILGVFSSKNQIKYCITCLKRPLKKKTKIVLKPIIA